MQIKKKNRAHFKICLGGMLVGLQGIALIGTLTSQTPLFQGVPESFGQYLYDLSYYAGFFLPAILGFGLLLWGIIELIVISKAKEDPKTEKKAKKSGIFSVVAVSGIGGLFHNMAQLLCAYFIIGSGVLLYFPVLCLSGIVCGMITGIAAQMLVKRRDLFEK